METSHKFILVLLLISIVGGILLSREINKAQKNEWHLNIITGRVVVIDSMKNDSVFSHFEMTNKPYKEKEELFRIHHKKIK